MYGNLGQLSNEVTSMNISHFFGDYQVLTIGCNNVFIRTNYWIVKQIRIEDKWDLGNNVLFENIPKKQIQAYKGVRGITEPVPAVWLRL